MEAEKLTALEVAQILDADLAEGLTPQKVEASIVKWGKNELTRVKPKSIFKRIWEGLTEPMMIILLVALAITVAVNIINVVNGEPFDIIECAGILVAIALSVTITIIMEGRSAKAFDALNKMGDDITVKVMRGGKLCLMSQNELVVGDVVRFETGDKIPVDCRLIKCVNFSTDESPLTGESSPVKKDYSVCYEGKNMPLAERKNMVYGGCFVTGGTADCVITAVGDSTEIGKIAKSLSAVEGQLTPLQHKLNKLGKIITIAGASAAALVFIIRLLTLAANSVLNFGNIQEIFITSIVLIVASVPEGLPTIVAVSLALNVIKMAKKNALVKKMVACETVGCINVICSDKTGTLTQNKMTVTDIFDGGTIIKPEQLKNKFLLNNFCVNTTATINKGEKNTDIFIGNPTECALLKAYEKSGARKKYSDVRADSQVEFTYSFSSENKKMTTIIKEGSGYVLYTKGAPEKIFDMCEMDSVVKQKAIALIESFQAQAKRVIAFAHGAAFKSGDYENDRQRLESKLIFDGFTVISDPVRKEVYAAVEQCKSAGVSIKMLTGDNIVTATAIALELKIIENESQVFNASQIENMTDDELAKCINQIKVVARSSPATKLRIVNTLQAQGDVVAVTGDGINDAPAIKNADVGIAMGITGTEVSKEASDIVLLDDSFSTIVESVQWGRGIYENFQRFIMFQLTVNLSAVLLVIIFSLIPGGEPPFNALELLWVNLIMDGPPALSLGLEAGSAALMKNSPTKRDASIVTRRMLARIVANGLFITGMLLAQSFTNFMQIPVELGKTVMFTGFVLFQLFNAFNARELGSRSILTSLKRNKVMWLVMLGTFILQVLITTFGDVVFNILPLDIISWLKVIAMAASVVVFNELYKLVTRFIIGLKAKRKSVKGGVKA